MSKVNLKLIIIQNFKSYSGRHCVGPLKQFTGVIGPNGSGKSNFMECVCFVMGEDIAYLRAHTAGVLPFKNSKRASVTAIFTLEDGTEKRFQRSIKQEALLYKIDGQSVPSSQYLSELKKIGVNVKGKNFLAYQGAVENMAMMRPKEKTERFEQISGSAELKDEYDRSKLLLTNAEEEARFAFLRKKGLLAEKKQSQLQCMEATKFMQLTAQLAEKKLKLQLFHLFHAERETNELEIELSQKQNELDKVETNRKSAQEELRRTKKEVGVLQREVAKCEQSIREAEALECNKRPDYIKAMEQVTHTQKKLESALKTLDEARRAHTAHQAEVHKLEEELRTAEAERARWDASPSRGAKDLHLKQGQVKRYEKLKMEASVQSAGYLQQLDSINREQKADQDRLDNEIRWKSDLEMQHSAKVKTKQDRLNRIHLLNQIIRSSESVVEEKKRMYGKLKSDVDSSRELVNALLAQLKEVTEQLGDAREDKFEEARRKKKHEIIECFKREVPGVYDRIFNLCQPTHPRYNVAATKVLGRYMEAIVVDTEKTAKKCIQILKERMWEPEAFLPLDYIKASRLKESLRGIKEPQGVKLLFDVLRFEPPAIHKAVLFVTHNALVCETPEDASMVAYDLGTTKGTCYDAVALDGTFYQRSGIISGGSVDLARKAKRWDEKHIIELKTKKEKLSEELREAMKKIRKESELTPVGLQIKELESRLKYAISDRDNTLKQIEVVENEIEILVNKLEASGPRIEKLKRTMRDHDITIQTIKEKINKVEDVIFQSFCRQIRVSNIRQYEEGELRFQQERAKQRMELDAHIDRITSHLEYARSRDTLKNVARWEHTASELENDVEAARAFEQSTRGKLERDASTVKALQAQLSAPQTTLLVAEERLVDTRLALAEIEGTIKLTATQMACIEANIQRKLGLRERIFKQCKMEDIVIPLLQGSLEDFSDTEDMPFTTQRMTGIKVDYTQLEEHLREISVEEIINKGDVLHKELKEMEARLESIQAPNKRALRKLKQLSERVKGSVKACISANKNRQKARMEFERVKKERLERFSRCFEHVSNEIDSIYKLLTVSQSAQAYLATENPEEPYLAGIKYCCVTPGKCFQPMTSLSGGEKVIASLALIYAMHSYEPAPFLFFDEVDASLDNTNTEKVVSYFQQKKKDAQIMAISLQEQLYGHADELVGICSKPGGGGSDIFTMSLDVYDDMSLSL